MRYLPTIFMLLLLVGNIILLCIAKHPQSKPLPPLSDQFDSVQVELLKWQDSTRRK